MTTEPNAAAVGDKARGASAVHRGSFWLALAAWLVPFAVIVSIWVPVLVHYFVPTPAISQEAVRLARVEPPDAVLAELGGLDLGARTAQGGDKLLREADGLLRGLVTTEDGSFTLARPFDPRDLEQGSLSWQLHYGSFGVPSTLLDAYTATGNEAYFALARDFILGWIAFEKTAWLPRGHLWDDHATAARTYVLTRFWRAYRSRADFDPEVGKLVLQAAARHAEFLSAPEHFTARSNHGVMQNLALWQLALAFPTIPMADSIAQLAWQRLQLQLGFMLSDEGVILEHSPGYHRFGVELLGMALRYLSIKGVAVDPAIALRYEKAVGVLAALRRPDGSLPLIGDTDSGPDERGPAVFARGKLQPAQGWVPAARDALYAHSGWAVWWNGLSHWPDERELSQLMLTWANFPGLAHKHADDLSLSLWGAGQTWWTNVGYWPFSSEMRRSAESWRGSNAPHFVGEDLADDRDSSLEHYTVTDDLAYADVLRKNAGQSSLRRQVVWTGDNIGVVVDCATSRAPRQSETIWTTVPDVTVKSLDSEHGYRLSRAGLDAHLDVHFIASDLDVKPTMRSLEPFSGWVVIGHAVQSTTSLVLTARTTPACWATVWTLVTHAADTGATKAPVAQLVDDKNWRISVPSEGSSVLIARTGDVLEVAGKHVPLHSLSDSREEDLRLRRNFMQVQASFPRFRDLLPYRYRASRLLLVAAVLSFVALVAGRRWAPRYTIALSTAALIGWITLGIWLHAYYFRF